MHLGPLHCVVSSCRFLIGPVAFAPGPFSFLAAILALLAHSIDRAVRWMAGREVVVG